MTRHEFHLADLPREHMRIRWVPETDDLHMNVVELRPGDEIGDHVNQLLDVIVTCLRGGAMLVIDGEEIHLHPGSIALIHRGAKRRLVAGEEGVVYTTVHRKRGGIMPTLASE